MYALIVTAIKHPVTVPSAIRRDFIMISVTPVSSKNHGKFQEKNLFSTNVTIKITILAKWTCNIFIASICSPSACRKHVLIFESCVISYRV